MWPAEPQAFNVSLTVSNCPHNGASSFFKVCPFKIQSLNNRLTSPWTLMNFKGINMSPTLRLISKSRKEIASTDILNSSRSCWKCHLLLVKLEMTSHVSEVIQLSGTALYLENPSQTSPGQVKGDWDYKTSSHLLLNSQLFLHYPLPRTEVGNLTPHSTQHLNAVWCFASPLPNGHSSFMSASPGNFLLIQSVTQ